MSKPARPNGGPHDGRLNMVVSQPAAGFAEVVLLGLDPEIGMFGAEGAEQGGNDVESGPDRVAQPQAGPGRLSRRARGLDRALEVGEGTSGQPGEDTTGRGESTKRVVRVSSA